ncbi:type III PLP-dependent enzyme [Dasania sp. GY-MA-18]|uniref:Type III PLP-dependent enzyme n=1 Tax=Dasania phycosphaerae TaxID=2950436 RepID=A0A9J6RS30_9GAMM|nr:MULTISPECIES: type III PLP-dependent enzyme [Dasania]MCR8924224.1 type III PLP-dependent enzyme [Dasania sp. GY-MA-18]MCZ0866877.1 type III PLP-dependent enzyme [Dasania phycosphaerae]MCZ0870381.1 type III PLP-dependent enzyme [Dasania phycosphaerae]
MSTIEILPAQLGEYYQAMTKEHGSPLLVLDRNKVRSRYRELCEALPNVELYYAMKSQCEPAFLEVLIAEGAGIDIATNGEIAILQQLEHRPKQLIHTHPFKKDADIRAALDFDCNTFVVDCVEELDKFAAYADKVELLLRVSCQNSAAKIDLSKKFGCHEASVASVLDEARRRGLTVKGLSFHVGSQCGSADMHVDAIALCARFFSSHPYLTCLDIGGGFPAPYDKTVVNLLDFCAPIRAALQQLDSRIRIIAEPGRCLSAPCFYSVATIMGVAAAEKAQWYFLDDGVYGSFSGAFYSGNRYPLQVFSDAAPESNAVLAGPTCDSVDVIYEDVMLPKLAINDVVVGPCMGAYTTVTASEFNAIAKPKLLIRDGHIEAVKQLQARS